MAKVKTTLDTHGVERVTQFRALDGTLHPTYAAARRHNTDTELERSLSAFFAQEYCQDGWGTEADIKRLAQHLRANWSIGHKGTPEPPAMEAA